MLEDPPKVARIVVETIEDLDVHHIGCDGQADWIEYVQVKTRAPGVDAWSLGDAEFAEFVLRCAHRLASEPGATFTFATNRDAQPKLRRALDGARVLRAGKSIGKLDCKALKAERMKMVGLLEERLPGLAPTGSQPLDIDLLFASITFDVSYRSSKQLMDALYKKMVERLTRSRLEVLEVLNQIDFDRTLSAARGEFDNIFTGAEVGERVDLVVDLDRARSWFAPISVTVQAVSPASSQASSVDTDDLAGKLLESLGRQLGGRGLRLEGLKELVQRAASPGEEATATATSDDSPDLVKAQEALRHGDFATAHSRFDRLLGRLGEQRTGDPAHDRALSRASSGLSEVLLAQSDIPGNLDEAARYAKLAVECDPRSADALVALARLAASQGDLATALARAREAFELDPTTNQARALFSRLRGLSEDPRQVIRELLQDEGGQWREERLASDPAVRRATGWLWLRAGEPSRALCEAEAATRLSPDSPDAHDLAGWAHLALALGERAGETVPLVAFAEWADPEHLASAGESFAQAVSVYEKRQQRRSALHARLGQVQVLVIQRRYEEVGILLRALEADEWRDSELGPAFLQTAITASVGREAWPDALEYYRQAEVLSRASGQQAPVEGAVAAAFAAVQVGEVDEAIGVLERARAAARPAEVLRLRAVKLEILAEAHRGDEASAEYEDLLPFADTDARAAVACARYLVRLSGDMPGAARHYERALDLSPERPELVLEKAAFQVAYRHDLPLAEAELLAFERDHPAIARDPTSHWASLFADVLVLQNRFADLVSLCERLREAGYPREALPQPLQNEVQALVEMRRLDDALRRCDEALSASPRSLELRIRRAEILMRQGKASEAFRAFEQLITHVHGSTDPTLHLHAAEAALLSGMEQRAWELGRRGRDLAKDDPTHMIHRLLGTAAMMAHNKDESVRHLQEYVARFPKEGWLWTFTGTLDEQVQFLQTTIREVRESFEVLGEHYQTGRVPLCAIAHVSGRSLANLWAWWSNPAEPGIPRLLFDFEGSPTQGREAESGTLASAKAVVIDYSALLTLRAVGALDLLPALFERVVVAQSLLDEIQRDCIVEGHPGLFDIRAFVTSNPKVELAWASPCGDRDERAIQGLGLAHWETLAITKERGLALFADDTALRQLARQEGLQFVGSRAALDTAVARGDRTHTQLDAARIQVALRRYRFVSIQASTMLEFVRHYETEPDGIQARRLIQSQAGGNQAALIGILRGATYLLWAGDDALEVKLRGTRFLIDWLATLRLEMLLRPAPEVRRMLPSIGQHRSLIAEVAEGAEPLLVVPPLDSGEALLIHCLAALVLRAMLDTAFGFAVRAEAGEAQVLVDDLRRGRRYAIFDPLLKTWLDDARYFLDLGEGALAAMRDNIEQPERARIRAAQLIRRFNLGAPPGGSS